MANSTRTLSPACEAHEIIGFDEIPPAGTNPLAYRVMRVSVPTCSHDEAPICEAWEIIGFDEVPPRDFLATPPCERDDVQAWARLDTAHENGAASDQCLMAVLWDADIPRPMARMYLRDWREHNPCEEIATWDSDAELICR